MDSVKFDPDCFLPPWVARTTDGQLELGAHLATKDGRRTGNAHIIGIEPAFWNPHITLYEVLTDAGNTMHYTEREIDQLFYRPKWVSDVTRVKRKFSREEHQ